MIHDSNDIVNCFLIDEITKEKLEKRSKAYEEIKTLLKNRILLYQKQLENTDNFTYSLVYSNIIEQLTDVYSIIVHYEHI